MFMITIRIVNFFNEIAWRLDDNPFMICLPYQVEKKTSLNFHFLSTIPTVWISFRRNSRSSESFYDMTRIKTYLISLLRHYHFIERTGLTHWCFETDYKAFQPGSMSETSAARIHQQLLPRTRWYNRVCPRNSLTYTEHCRGLLVIGIVLSRVC